jgi:seryl-tRNA synthetase
MLDIKLIRDNPEAIRRGAELKNMKVDLTLLLSLDTQRRSLQTKIQDLVAEQNRAGKELGPLMGLIKKETDLAKRAELEQKAEALKARPLAIKAEAVQLDEQLKAIEPEIDAILLTLPLPPDDDVPIGKSAEDNVVIATCGTPRVFDFKPKSHVELGEALGLFSVERGVKLAGSRSYVLTGAGALLHNAILRMAMDFMVFENNFTPMSVPVMVREHAMRATGFFPAGREQAYRVGEIADPAEDLRFLTGTGEVSLTAYHMDETLDEKDLPKTYVTVSTCFRREAGTYGKDTSGLYRIHQFDKVEQVVICKNDKEESKRWHKKMLSFSEEMLKRLQLPYRLLQCCTGDLGVKNASMIDVETWMPSRGTAGGYGETHSASRLYDFQARRCNLRYKGTDGKTLFCHTLNNTVIASPRILIPILENYQNPDGSITVPVALRKYMNNMDVIR